MNLLHTLSLLKSVELLLLEVRLMSRNMADSAVATGLALPHPEGVRIPLGASILSCRLHWSNTSWTRMMVLPMRIVTLLSSVGGKSVFYFNSIHVKWLAILFAGEWIWVWEGRTPFSQEISLGTGCWTLLSFFLMSGYSPWNVLSVVVPSTPSRLSRSEARSRFNGFVSCI